MSNSEFSKEDIKKLGTLARIDISDEESVRLAGELTSILQYVEKLDQYDVSDIEPLSHVHGSTNVMRDDEERDFPQKDLMRKEAPDTSGTFIRVPLIVSQNESE